MGPATFPLILVGAIAAFLLGSRWRHHRRSRSDHKAAVVQARKAQSVKRLALVALFGAIVVNAVFYWGLANAKQTGQDGTPAPTITPVPSTSQSPHRPPSPSARPSH
jgi:hypothetical protein